MGRLSNTLSPASGAVAAAAAAALPDLHLGRVGYMFSSGLTADDTKQCIITRPLLEHLALRHVQSSSIPL